MPDQPRDDQVENPRGGKASAWARFKLWLRAHHMTLMTLPDTPHSIALGSAIGMFFGFTPLFTLKTLLAFLITWLFRANKTAAVITVTLHDVLLPFVPAMFFWQYKLGCGRSTIASRNARV